MGKGIREREMEGGGREREIEGGAERGRWGKRSEGEEEKRKQRNWKEEETTEG